MLLLDTAVPDRLTLPPVDVDAVFGAELVDRAERYERFLRWSFVLSQIALVATLVVFARKGVALTRESAAGRIGTGMLLGMLGLAIVWIVQLPFGLADLWWARRHDVTDLGYLEWALSGWVELGVIFLSICLSLLIVMAIAGPLGDHWWLPGSLVFVVIGTAVAFGSPYLLAAGTDTDRLDDPAIEAAAREYAREQGIDEVPMYVEVVSDYTDQANAYAAGFGPTRRVVLWDTLVDNFREGEVKVVVAHEIGHHSSEHILKGSAWYALLAIPGAFIVARVTRRRGGMRNAEAVPLGLLTVVVLSLLALPFTNWVTRRMETEADWKALQSSEQPDAMRGLFKGFAEESLGDPSPPWWAHVLLDSHPTYEQRVAMAEAWKAQR